MLPRHGVDAVPLAREERGEVRASEVLVQRDPGGVGRSEPADARGVARVVVRTDEVQSHRLPARPHPAQDLDDVLEPLLGRDASERDEAVLARLPGDGGEVARHRRVKDDRLDPVERPDAGGDERRVDEREVPPDTVVRYPPEAPAGAVVERHHGARAVVPAQVDLRPDRVELRVVHVLDTRPAEVGLVVGGHQHVMIRRQAPGPAQEERVLQEGERGRRERAEPA